MKKLHLSILSVALIFLFNACAPIQTQSSKGQINENLPKIDELKTISEISSIAFEWNAQYNQGIAGFYLYRAKKDEEFKLIATIKNKYQTHFIDEKLEPNTAYSYMMRTFNDLGHISLEGKVVQVRTQNRIEAVPFVQAVANLPYRTKLIWRPHPDLRVASYVVERADAKELDFSFLAEVKNRLSAEYIDEGLKADQSFAYRVFAKNYDGTYSESSQIIYSSTKALPPQISHLNASNNIAHKIILTWDNEPFKDLAYYRIYSSSSSFLPFTTLAQTESNSYEDVLNEAGKERLYKVSIIDKDGLESPLSDAVSGQTLAAPLAPTINLTAVRADGIELGWVDADNRAVSYNLKRYGSDGDVLYKGINSKTFKDTKITQGVSYTYEITAVDENGIQSQPSQRVKIGAN